MTRQVVIGAGKVGCELPGMSADDVPYQISQRADFFEEEVGLETTLKRPIVNTRDEPHCDASKYRRLHVIVGDANMSEVATYLKVGTTAIVLAMIEDDELGDDWLLANPVAAIRQVSHDPALQRSDPAAQRSAGHGARGAVGIARAGPEVRAVARPGGWSASPSVPTCSPGGRPCWPGSSATARLGGRVVDWVAKQRLVEGYADRHGLKVDRRPAEGTRPAVPRPAPRQVPGPARRAGDDRRPTPRCTTAMTEPPTTTRAYFRGRCLAKWPDDIVAANWDWLVFDIGRDPLRRVPMMEPLRGTAEHVARLIDESDTPAELLARLGA